MEAESSKHVLRMFWNSPLEEEDMFVTYIKKLLTVLQEICSLKSFSSAHCARWHWHITFFNVLIVKHHLSFFFQHLLLKAPCPLPPPPSDPLEFHKWLVNWSVFRTDVVNSELLLSFMRNLKIHQFRKSYFNFSCDDTNVNEQFTAWNCSTNHHYYYYLHEACFLGNIPGPFLPASSQVPC